MRLAVSAIALPNFDHHRELLFLAESGIEGLEASPTKAWPDPAKVGPRDVSAYRRMVEHAGLRIVGIHSLLYGRSDLGWFRTPETRAATLDYLVHLSDICSDLGGGSMVFGSGGSRMRSGLDRDEADDWAVDFLGELAHRISGHGTCLALEPLAEEHTDYLHTLGHTLDLVQRVNRPEIRVHLDVAAAYASDEINADTFQSIAPVLAHVHVNEPGLGVLKGAVNHSHAARLLSTIGYSGFCSLEQRMVNTQDIIGPLKESLDTMNKHYGCFSAGNNDHACAQ